MDPLRLQSFIEKAEDELARIRGSLLLFAQERPSIGELSQLGRGMGLVKSKADEIGLLEIAHLAGECTASLGHLTSVDCLDLEAQVNRSLDIISRIEANLLQIPLRSDAFIADVNELVEASFNHLKNEQSDEQLVVPEVEATDEDFDIDDETLEIFRSEAEGLLANISTNLTTLASAPDDHNALWEIRRNAHTFKGAAGIIGFREASTLAHRVEDLLDKMVDSRCGADGRVLDLLSASAGRLSDMTTGKYIVEDPETALTLSDDFDRLLASLPAQSSQTKTSARLPQSINGKGKNLNHSSGEHTDAVAPALTSIVRVSLDRLDDLLRVSQGILANRLALEERYAELKDIADSPHNDLLIAFESLINAQHCLADEMQQKLQRIRMVRFGTLEMRLNRAVHITCLEEGKKAAVVIENADLEVDTQVLDALIEPLLHLLKNAVVHGIEPPETRRLLGKQEKGEICISVNTDGNHVILSVEDNGRGISGPKIIEKALASGIIDQQFATAIDEETVYSLIFQRGLTTADSLNLNAGRGVGMSIVKESVESRGGTVGIESELQNGTKFTIRMPLTLPTSRAQNSTPEVVEIANTSTGQPLVLIVEDSPSVRRMTAKIAEEAGLNAITAVDGAEALELLLSGAFEPDLILSDVEMPNMDGWEFLEYVKADTNLGHIPVVMVTSLNSDEYRQKASSLGAADYLVKPFGVKELDRVCENLLKEVAVV